MNQKHIKGQKVDLDAEMAFPVNVENMLPTNTNSWIG